ncbi:MAG: IMP dehydrogenase, partial [Lentisphaeraceae bacterium]|nr:IMP dehydrogenase [Lentisphaeraceae bacterium]
MEQSPYVGLTFDDVTLVTQYADFLPEDTSIKSKFSRNINLNIPFVSAAMDTVTEAGMAIAIANMGGIGVVHKNLSIEAQAHEVSKVKHYANGLIQNPVVFKDTDTVGDILRTKEEKSYPFSGFPIIDNSNNLVGILTAKDLKFATPSSPVKEVMTSELITAGSETTLDQAYALMIKNKIGKLPLVNSENRLVGLYSFHDVDALHSGTEKEQNFDSKYQLRVSAAMSPYDHQRAEALFDAGVDAFVIDTAHGHSRGVIETVKELKKKYPEVDVVAGNVGTGEGAKALLD